MTTFSQPLKHHFKIYKLILCCIYFLAFTCISPLAIQAKRERIENDHSKNSVPLELQKQATNPLPVVMNVQFENTSIFESHGNTGYGNQISITPVIPIFIENFPDVIVQPCLPLLVNPGQGKMGLGDFLLFQGFILPPSGKWGAWAVGPVLSFPTATRETTGSGKWQIGIVAAVSVTRYSAWNFGVLLYNLKSFAGDSHRNNINMLFIEPTLTYNFPKGWFLGIANQTSSFNLEKGGAPTIFMGIQGGKVFKVGGQAMSLSLSPFFVPVHDGPNPKYGLQLNWSLFFPPRTP